MPLYGDWNILSMKLKTLHKSLTPHLTARLYENGELVLNTMIEHIENQDLDWSPLSENTIRLKGNDTIYKETGFLVDNLVLEKVQPKFNEIAVFIGFSNTKVHEPSGLKFCELMVMLEYGTSKMPPRPLVRPTWEETQKLVRKNLENAISEILSKK